jgi:gluconate 5-dehydrogenase
MIPRGAGKIITTCSVMTRVARGNVAPYTASKGAVANLTKAMCADWGPLGIQANGIGPGYFKTELTQALVDDPAFTEWLEKRTPAGRWGNVDDLIGAAIYLASPASNYVNGHVLYVDGGMTAVI